MPAGRIYATPFPPMPSMRELEKNERRVLVAIFVRAAMNMHAAGAGLQYSTRRLAATHYKMARLGLLRLVEVEGGGVYIESPADLHVERLH